MLDLVGNPEDSRFSHNAVHMILSVRTDMSEPKVDKTTLRGVV